MNLERRLQISAHSKKLKWFTEILKRSRKQTQICSEKKQNQETEAVLSLM